MAEDPSREPTVTGLLETALYVADPPTVAKFYHEAMGFVPMLESERLIALDTGQRNVLLVFRKGTTSADLPTDGGTVPGHEGEGRLHLAFAIAADDYEAWRARLASHGVPLLSEVTWARGGRSLYFSDPAGNVVELATPGLWPNY